VRAPERVTERDLATRRALLGVTAVATLAMQAIASARVGDLLLYRASVALSSLGVFAAAWASRDVQIRSPLARLALCAMAAASFWLAVLELLLLRGPVLARGFLALVAAGLVHGGVLFFVTTPRAATARDEVTGRLVLAAAATALTLFAVEAGFQAVMPADVYDIVPDQPGAPPWWIAHPGVPWVARPGFRGRYLHPEFRGSRVDINALGFRDGLDETAPPAPGEASVLVLGDSLVFGTGVDVEETFHRIVERRGQEITARPLRVYGAGVSGFGQFDELHYLEELAPRIRPDVVIAGLYEGNDLEDNVNARARGAAHASPAPGPVDTRAALVRFLHGVIRARFWFGSSAAFQYALPTVERPLVWLHVISPLVPTNAMLDMSLLVSPPPAIEDALATTREALEALSARCAALHADLIVLVIPAAIQAEPARWEDFLGLHPAAQRSSYSRTALHDGLVRMIRSLGVRAVDPLPRLAAEAGAGRPCYHREGHWNAAGHRLAADLLVTELADVFGRREGSGPVRSVSGSR
jgi:hypothetical protein